MLPNLSSNLRANDTAQPIHKLSEKLLRISGPNQFWPQAISILHQLFAYSNINLFLIKNQKKPYLHTALWAGQRPPQKEMATLNQALVAQSGTITDALADGQARINPQPAYTLPPGLPHIQSEVVIPLVFENALIGLLQVFNLPSDQLTPETLFNVQIIGNHLVMAHEVMTLRQRVRRHTYEKQILTQSNATLGSSMDRDEVLTVMARQMTQAVRAGACVICRWSEKRQLITALAEYVEPHPDNPPRAWRNLNAPLPINQDPLGEKLLTTLQPVTLRGQDTGGLAGQANQWKRHGWHSLLAIPMQSQGNVLGLVEIYDRTAKRIFSQADIQLADALARQTAIAIERSELFYELRTRLAEVSTFYTLSQKIISTLNLEELLKNLVSTIREIVDCRACVIFLLDETEAFLEIKAASGLKPHWEKRARLAVGQGAAGRSVAEKKTIYIPDTQKDPSFIFFDRAVRSLIVVPMIHQNKAVGAINLDHSLPRAFGKAQERLLSVVAAQAAVTIENATLFNRVRSEEQRTRAIIQHMADGLLMIGPGGIIQSVNSALAMMLGMHPSEIVGQNAHSNDLDYRLAAVCAPATVKARSGVLANEVKIPGSNPQVLRVFASIVTDKLGYPIGEVRVVHDVTKERELEQMKDDLLSTVSHELRTPLFSIRGFVHLLLDDDPPPPETQRDFLQIIAREANQLANMVTNLLDSNKISSGEVEVTKEPLQLGDIIRRTCQKLQGYALNEAVTPSLDVPPNLPLILGNAQQLEQVFTNIIGNAIKFTPQNGSISITCEVVGTRYIIARIADTGIGISETDLEHIFSRFYQVDHNADAQQPGSGLGLHIARQLVEQHSGQIWAESQPGQGSAFFIKLPILN